MHGDGEKKRILRQSHDHDLCIECQTGEISRQRRLWKSAVTGRVRERGPTADGEHSESCNCKVRQDLRR